jgi:hypothetical protein
LDQIDWNTNDVINQVDGEVSWDAESPRIHKNAKLNVTQKFEYRIFEKLSENIIECNNALFGGDPEPFIPKFCWCYNYKPPSDDFVGEEEEVVEIDEAYVADIAEKNAAK